MGCWNEVLLAGLSSETVKGIYEAKHQAGGKVKKDDKSLMTELVNKGEQRDKLPLGRSASDSL